MGLISRVSSRTYRSFTSCTKSKLIIMLKIVSPRILPRISARNGSLKINNLDPSLRPNEVIAFFEADKGIIYSRTEKRSNMILDFTNDSTIKEIMDNRQSINMGDDRKLFFQKISDTEPFISICANIPNANIATLRNIDKFQNVFINLNRNSDLVRFQFRDAESAVDALYSNIEVDGQPLNLFIEKDGRFSMNTFSVFLGGIPSETPNSAILSHPDIAGNIIHIKQGTNAKFAFLYLRDLAHVDKLQKNGLKIDGVDISLEMTGVAKPKLDDTITLTVASDREFSESELEELGQANQIPFSNGKGYLTFINDLDKDEAKNLILNGVKINGEHFKVSARNECVLTKIFKFPKEFDNSDIEAALDGQMYNLFEGKSNKMGFVTFFDEHDANAFRSINIKGQNVIGEMMDHNPKEAYKHTVFVEFNPRGFPDITPEQVKASEPFRILNSKENYSADAFTDKRNQTVGIIKCRFKKSAETLIDQGVMIDGKWLMMNLQ